MIDNDKKPEPNGPIEPTSNWVAIYLDKNNIIQHVITSGLIPEDFDGYKALIVEKEPLYKFTKAGNDIKGAITYDGKFLVSGNALKRNHKPSIYRIIRYALSKQRYMASALIRVRELYVQTRTKNNDSPAIVELIRNIQSNLISVFIASLLSSSFIFLISHKILFGAKNWSDFVTLFIPLFSASIVLVTLYSSIRENRAISKQERQQTVKPFLFMITENINFGLAKEPDPFDEKVLRYQVIDLYDNYYKGFLTITNNGLGLASNIDFYIVKFDHLRKLDGDQFHLKKDEERKAIFYISREAIIDKGRIISVYKNVYGQLQICRHDLNINEDNTINFTSDEYVEEGSPFYKWVLKHL